MNQKVDCYHCLYFKTCLKSFALKVCLSFRVTDKDMVENNKVWHKLVLEYQGQSSRLPIKEGDKKGGNNE